MTSPRPVGRIRVTAAAESRNPAGSYRAALDDAADCAGSVSGWLEYDLTIGSRRVRLRFAGRTLEPLLLPPLMHAVTEPAGLASAVLSIWDSVSTGVTGPEQPWRSDAVLGRTAVRGFDGVAQDPGSGCVSAFDPAARRGVLWAPDPACVAWYERAAPLRTLLNWALAGPASRLVHAAVVGSGRSGALFAGPGGSGKSTLALACTERGLGLVGDDYVLLEGDRAYAVHATAKVDARSLELLGSRPQAFPPGGMDGEKVVLAVEVLRETRIGAVVLPAVTPGHAALSPATGAEALRALAPSTIFQMPPTAVPLAPLAALVRSVPSYRLETGADPRAAAALVEEALGA